MACHPSSTVRLLANARHVARAPQLSSSRPRKCLSIPQRSRQRNVTDVLLHRSRRLLSISKNQSFGTTSAVNSVRPSTPLGNEPTDKLSFTPCPRTVRGREPTPNILYL